MHSRRVLFPDVFNHAKVGSLRMPWLYPWGFSRAPGGLSLTLVHILVHNGFIVEYNVHEAKTHFSRLLQKVAAGEEVTIARDGVPVARLVPVEVAKTPRKLGMYSGKIWMADDFDAPLPADILAGFHGEELPVKKAKKKKK